MKNVQLETITAEIVKLHNSGKGLSYPEIAKKFNREGKTTVRGKPFTPINTFYLVNNQKYKKTKSAPKGPRKPPEPESAPTFSNLKKEYVRLAIRNIEESVAALKRELDL